MRKKFIAGNWKMFTTTPSAEKLTTDLVRGLGNENRVRVAVCPPFPYLALVAKLLAGSPIALGAQNLYPEKEGAFTGEVSPTMLLDVGCKLVILGHSERRQKMGEVDAFINRKVHAALAAGLDVILCVGETLQEREANQAEKVLDAHLTTGLAGVSGATLHKVTIAYEPVWAIGTGRHATPDLAQAAHAFIRRRVAELCGAGPAAELIIQYGGSVKPENAALLLNEPDVDGALVGGACLQAELFLPIIRAGIK